MGVRQVPRDAPLSGNRETHGAYGAPSRIVEAEVAGAGGCPALESDGEPEGRRVHVLLAHQRHARDAHPSSADPGLEVRAEPAAAYYQLDFTRCTNLGRRHGRERRV